MPPATMAVIDWVLTFSAFGAEGEIHATGIPEARIRCHKVVVRRVDEDLQVHTLAIAVQLIRPDRPSRLGKTQGNHRQNIGGDIGNEARQQKGPASGNAVRASSMKP